MNASISNLQEIKSEAWKRQPEKTLRKSNPQVQNKEGFMGVKRRLQNVKMSNNSNDFKGLGKLKVKPK